MDSVNSLLSLWWVVGKVGCENEEERPVAGRGFRLWKRRW